MLILVCNAGSTSLKYRLFDMPSPEVIVEGKVERVGRDDAIYSYKNFRTGFEEKKTGLSIPTYAQGIQLFLDYLLHEEYGALKDIKELEAIGFKTVLAKGFYGVHELTEEVIHAMEEFIAVAPAPNPPDIEAIRMFKEILPDKRMVGCFETAFHTTIPMYRKMYGIPYEWYEQYGIQRFGYHGASHGYISRRVKAMAGEEFKLISCHLGGSGSICANLNGQSMDNSFGFSLQTGLPHANRAGDMDAYIFPFLMAQGMSAEEIAYGLDKKGGLLGVSGVSNDLRDVQEAADAGNERAQLAIDMYADAILRYVGSYYAELGGLDYLVFTGGIGENSAAIREKVCTRLAHMGVDFDHESNAALRGEGVISKPGSPVTVMVIPANEEVGIAQTIYEQFA